MTDADLAAAWAAVHDATPEGWYVGRPYFDERHNRWEQYAFDESETPVVGKRSREWIAVPPTEVRCVREMALCLEELRGALAEVGKDPPLTGRATSEAQVEPKSVSRSG